MTLKVNSSYIIINQWERNDPNQPAVKHAQADQERNNSRYRKGTGINMINFEEELKNFKPSLEVEEAEQAIYNHELTDMTDVMQEMLQELKQQNR